MTAPVQYGPRVTGVCAYLWHGQFLSRDRTCQAARELFGVPVWPGAVTGMVRRVAATLGAPLEAIRTALIAAPVAHFDETGFRVVGKLAWVHCASSGQWCWAAQAADAQRKMKRLADASRATDGTLDHLDRPSWPPPGTNTTPRS